MDNGDVIRTKTVKSFFENDDCSGWVSFSAGKGRRIVLLVLGDESEGQEDRLDPVAALCSFGWTPPSDLITASAMSAGTAETQSGSGLQPASATAESPDAQNTSEEP